MLFKKDQNFILLLRQPRDIDVNNLQHKKINKRKPLQPKVERKQRLTIKLNNKKIQVPSKHSAQITRKLQYARVKMKVIQRFPLSCNLKALRVQSLQMVKDLVWDQNMFLNNIPTQERRVKLVILPICKSKEHLRSNINVKQALLQHKLSLRKTAHRKGSDPMQFGTKIRINGRCPKAQIFTTNSFTARIIIQESIAENSNRLATP